jgi:hypothetical protein
MSHKESMASRRARLFDQRCTMSKSFSICRTSPHMGAVRQKIDWGTLRRDGILGSSRSKGDSGEFQRSDFDS